MKKIKILLATAIIGAFFLTACSKDDAPSGAVTNGSITEKWNPTKTVITANGLSNTVDYTQNQPACTGKDYIQFTTTNVLNNVVYNRSADGVCSESAASPATYTKSGNTLTVVGGEYDGTYTITTLSGSELIVKSVESVSGTQITANSYFTKAVN